MNSEQGLSAKRNNKKTIIKMIAFWLGVALVCFGLPSLVKSLMPESVSSSVGVLQVAPRITIREDDSWHFHGFACTGNCSVHLKGYCWARKKRIQDEASCRSNSKSFMQGCFAYYKHGGSDRDFDESYRQSRSISELCDEE